MSTETCFTPASNKLLVLISPPTCIDWPSVVEEKNVYSSHSLWPHLAYYVTTNTAIRSFHYHFPVTWSQKWRRGLIGLDQICLFLPILLFFSAQIFYPFCILLYPFCFLSHTFCFSSRIMLLMNDGCIKFDTMTI